MNNQIIEYEAGHGTDYATDFGLTAMALNRAYNDREYSALLEKLRAKKYGPNYMYTGLNGKPQYNHGTVTGRWTASTPNYHYGIHSGNLRKDRYDELEIERMKLCAHLKATWFVFNYNAAVDRDITAADYDYANIEERSLLMHYEAFKKRVYERIEDVSGSSWCAAAEVDAISISDIEDWDWYDPEAYADDLMSNWNE